MTQHPRGGPNPRHADLTPAQLWGWGSLAFLAELGIFLGAGLVAYRCAAPALGRPLGGLAAVTAAVGFGAVWAVFFSPNSARRLTLWPRAVCALVMVLLVATGLWLTGSPAAAVVLAVLGALGTIVAQPMMRPRPRSTA